MNYLRRFTSNITSIPEPELFNYPFNYTPHQLSKIAADEVMNELENRSFNHDFGLEGSSNTSIGKMFGVLVVKLQDQSLGYLAAFSGKLGESNFHKGFVPPIFDSLDENGFYRKGEEKLNTINSKIKFLEESPEFKEEQQKLDQLIRKVNHQISVLKTFLKEKKNQRNQFRETNKDTKLALLGKLKWESFSQQYFYKKYRKHLQQKINHQQKKVDDLKNEIASFKEQRRNLSNHLQQKLFESYTFLNANDEEKDLLDIFEMIGPPPSGSGECAAPKLLNYAYQHNLKPLCIAEFWWGTSPKSEIRKHGQFYPSCKSKCKPILGHMLQGLHVEKDPIQKNYEEKEIEILYDDPNMCIINKPHEFLSVPGKSIFSSVKTEIEKRYPSATGPLIVHRLDMSTSGLMIIAKDLKTYKNLQEQFINRTVQKRYIAILDGTLDTDNGTIELPLRVDLDNRPQQLVCYDHGKPAKTFYKVIKRENGYTFIHFFPYTGRTHQLRVHAAHHDGLNIPIVGDDLYGRKSQRLYLHAEHLKFWHPVKNEKFEITCPANFKFETNG